MDRTEHTQELGNNNRTHGRPLVRPNRPKRNPGPDTTDLKSWPNEQTKGQNWAKPKRSKTNDGQKQRDSRPVTLGPDPRPTVAQTDAGPD